MESVIQNAIFQNAGGIGAIAATAMQIAKHQTWHKDANQSATMSSASLIMDCVLYQFRMEAHGALKDAREKW
jgi:hypothetical protein